MPHLPVVGGIGTSRLLKAPQHISRPGVVRAPSCIAVPPRLLLQQAAFLRSSNISDIWRPRSESSLVLSHPQLLSSRRQVQCAAWPQLNPQSGDASRTNNFGYVYAVAPDCMTCAAAACVSRPNHDATAGITWGPVVAAVLCRWLHDRGSLPK